MHMELERAARDRTSLELKCEELGGRLDQCKRTVGALEQERTEVMQSCNTLSQQVDRLETELGGQQDISARTQQDIHTLHQVRTYMHCTRSGHTCTAPGQDMKSCGLVAECFNAI